jgi:hypothetical protein
MCWSITAPDLGGFARYGSIRLQPVSGLDGMTAEIPLQNPKSREAYFSPK